MNGCIGIFDGEGAKHCKRGKESLRRSGEKDVTAGGRITEGSMEEGAFEPVLKEQGGFLQVDREV